MKLVFIRHPQTNANAEKKIYGRTEADYSKAGADSVEWVIEQTKDMNFHRIYASPMKRTSILAQKIGEKHGFNPADIIYSDDLLEMHMGIFEDKSIKEVKADYPEEFDHFITNSSTYQIPEGESFGMVQERAVDFIKKLVKEMNEEGKTEHVESETEQEELPASGSNDEKTILIVAHAMIIRGILAWMLNMNLDDIWHIDIKPASITEVLYKYDYGMILSLNSPESH